VKAENRTPAFSSDGLEEWLQMKWVHLFNRGKEAKTIPSARQSWEEFAKTTMEEYEELVSKNEREPDLTTLLPWNVKKQLDELFKHKFQRNNNNPDISLTYCRTHGMVYKTITKPS